ncbi:MAG: DUF1573 domain-containing protein [Isosphaeraceae bacterium]|nr:DUF1573 domain-containing protein [Isosphaeraceae bacterium]
MMRWILLSLVVVALAAIGTVASFYLSPVTTEVISNLRTTPDPSRTGPPGKAVVVEGSTTYDFGTLPQKTEGSHEWTIKNEGEGELVIQMGKTTCSCTYAEPKEGEQVRLKKGETKKIKVTFNTKEWDKFHQQAPILVMNDPDTQEITLTIDGVVRPAIVTYPADKVFALATIANDATVTRDAAIFSIDRPETKVLSTSVSNPDAVSVEVREMTPSECEQFNIKQGRRLVVSLKPNAKLGQFSEEVSVKLDHPNQDSVKFTLVGTRVGPISVFPDRIRLFDVRAREGATQTLTMLVRGKDDTKFTVDHAPKELEVAVASMGKFGDGKVQKYQLTIKIPPNSRPGSINDDIILKTDHPGAAELKIPVSVVVGQAG